MSQEKILIIDDEIFYKIGRRYSLLSKLETGRFNYEEMKCKELAEHLQVLYGC